MIERSSGNGQNGTNGNSQHSASPDTAPLMAGITRQDLDHLFDEASHPAIHIKQRPRTVPREAETLFEDKDAAGLFDADEVASLFEDTTTDSVPRALVPSRLRPATHAVIKPLCSLPRNARPSTPPRRGPRKWPALKPVLAQTPSPAPTQPCRVEPEPEEHDTWPDLPLIPPQAPPELPVAPALADAPESAPPEPGLELILKPEPALPVADATPAPLPEPVVQVPPKPEPILAVAHVAPAPLPEAVVEFPPAPAPAPRPAAEPTPPVATERSLPARHVHQFEPTQEITLPRASRSRLVPLIISAFAAGAAMAALLLLLLGPGHDSASRQPDLATRPDPVLAPVAAPLAEPPSLAVVPIPVPIPVASAPLTAAPAELTLTQRLARAGDRATEIILPCLTEKNRRYQKVAVYLTPAGTIRRAFIAETPWATTQNRRCMRRLLEWQDLGLPSLPGGFVEWHLFMGETPARAQLSRPKELRE